MTPRRKPDAGPWHNTIKAAELLSTSKWTVYRLIESGRLRASRLTTKPGHLAWRISQQAIEELMAAGEYQPPTAKAGTLPTTRPRRATTAAAVLAALCLLLLAGCGSDAGDCPGIAAGIALWTSEAQQAGTKAGLDLALGELAKAQAAWRAAGCDGGSA